MTPTHKRPCSLFLFDLDGTLIDSKADIAFTLNLVLDQLRLPPLPEAIIQDFVGEGLRRLIERSLQHSTGAPAAEDLVLKGMGIFMDAYEAHLLDNTRLFPGVREGLDLLGWARFAIVSNKPERFCRRILEGLGVINRFPAIVGGDTTPWRKPDPRPLLAAMKDCAAAAWETAMVGDSPLDIEAGKAAGTVTCGFLGGFRPQEELEAAGCDILIRSLPELRDHFRQPS